MGVNTGVKYIGKEAVYQDNILRTGLVWEKGETHSLPVTMAKEFLKHPSVFSEVPGFEYVSASSSGAGIGDLSVGGRVLVNRKSDRSVITCKPWGIQYSRATTLGTTHGMAISFPNQFDAIEIGYVHLGGNGAATGIIACIASTDDIGPCDYSLGGADANLKKFVTPRLAGTEYNALNSKGWRAVTWGGASSASCIDAGAGNIDVAWSDLIQCDAKPDANGSGWYNMLLRIYPGAGPCSYGGMTGAASGNQYNAEAGPAKLMYATRSGDNVTNPSTWTSAMTPTYSDTPAPSVIIRAHGRNDAGARTVMFIGDSRFDTNTETGATKAYHNFAFEFEAQANAAGAPCRVVKSATGGMASANFCQQGLKLLSKIAPDVACYLGYTVNDGTPITADIMAMARYRVIQFVEQCRAQGTVPVVVTAFPRTSMTAQDMVYLTAFEGFVAALGVIAYSPLRKYGNADGSWMSGLNADGNHATQATYAAMAADLRAALISAGAM